MKQPFIGEMHSICYTSAAGLRTLWKNKFLLILLNNGGSRYYLEHKEVLLVLLIDIWIIGSTNITVEIFNNFNRLNNNGTQEVKDLFISNKKLMQRMQTFNDIYYIIKFKIISFFISIFSFNYIIK